MEQTESSPPNSAQREKGDERLPLWWLILSPLLLGSVPGIFALWDKENLSRIITDWAVGGCVGTLLLIAYFRICARFDRRRRESGRDEDGSPYYQEVCLGVCVALLCGTNTFLRARDLIEAVATTLLIILMFPAMLMLLERRAWKKRRGAQK